MLTAEQARRPEDLPASQADTPTSVGTPIEVRHITLTLIGVAATILLLRFMRSVLIPFVISGLMFYALDPAVDWLQRSRVPRALGAAVVLLAVVLGGAALTYALQDQAMTVVDQMPTAARRLARTLQRNGAQGPTAIEKVQQAADELQKPSNAPVSTAPGVVAVQVEQQRFQASTYVWAGSLGLLSALNQLIMILFLTYFMLLSDQLFKRKLVEIAGPALAQKKVTVQILEDIADQIERFLVIQILTSALVAVATWGALWALGLQQAALWGLAAGILNSIPYYGPLVVTGGLGLVGFLQFQSLQRAATVAVVALIITSVEGVLLTPRLLGKAAEMNTVAVFAGLLFWSWIWGAWGTLLAVPMMMVFKVVCDRIERLHPIGHLLGE